jgi:signal transduction histidine kinase
MQVRTKFSDNDLKRQQLIRYFGWVGIITIIISILPDIYFGLWKSAFLTLLLGFPLGLVVFLNRNYIDIASNVLIFWLLFILTSFSLILGRDANVHIMLLIIILATPFTIDPQKKWLIYVHISSPILVYLFLELNNFYLPFVPKLSDITPEHIKIFGIINLLVVFMIVPLSTIVILASNHKFANEIKKANELLKTRNTELTKKNEALDQFAYRVSHDLRSPIASLKGLLNILADETQLAQIRQYHQLMQKSLFRLDDFIRDILDQAQNLRTELNISHLDLNQVIKDIFDQLQFANPDNRVELRLNIQANAPMFASDLYRLKIIFHNLIANAIRYHDPQKSPAWLTISGKFDEKQAIIRIEDNGLGIAQEHQTKVFEMFYRANPNIKGTGLGLFLVKECIDKLAGEIILNSELGKGTIFTIKIPNNPIDFIID